MTRIEPSADQPALRVAYQGIAGAFSEAAVQRYWRGKAIAVATPTFEETVDALIRGSVDRALIPISNSSIGAIDAACAVLASHGSAIRTLGEVEIPVHHQLMARPGTSRESVLYVGSHPAALAQCRKLFATNPELIPCDAFDTAGAARELASASPGRTEQGAGRWHSALGIDPSRCAALANEAAARAYGLVILMHNVQDDLDNMTRFAVIGLTEPHQPPSGA